MRKVLYILGGLDDSDLQWLLDAGGLRSVPEGTEIIREGRDVGQLFIVLDGEFGVSLAGRELARLADGEVVGDMSLLDSRPPNATVRARTDSKVFAVPHAALRGKLAADPEFASRFYRALCIFLANRLNRADVMIGAGARVAGLEAGERVDELSPQALEGVAMAGARFAWFRNRVESPSQFLAARS